MMARNTKIIAADVTLKRAFPKDIAPPQLLFDFAAWLSQRTKREIGAYFLKPQHEASDYVPSGVSIENDLALFFSLTDGSAAGLWFGETRDPDAAPFVVIGSEGGLDIYAPNLACMMHRMAMDALEEGYLEEDFSFRANKEKVTKALLDWLKAHPVAWPIIEATQPADYFKCDDKSADRWLEQKIIAFEAAQAGDSDLSAIAAILTEAGYTPEPIDLSELAEGLETYDDLLGGRETEDTSHDDADDAFEDDDDTDYIFPTEFRVYAAGNRFAIVLGAAMVPEAADSLEPVPEKTVKALKPYLLALRERFADENTGEGLWPLAALTLDGQGRANVEPIYSHGYPMGYDGFPPEAFAADQARRPREKRKLAAWHKELLDEAK